MIALYICLLVISSLGLCIHIYVNKYSPLIYPYLFWILYELPKLEYYLIYDIEHINITYYFYVIIGAILYFLGIISNTILIRKRRKQTLILFKDFNIFKKISSFLFKISLIYFIFLLED